MQVDESKVNEMLAERTQARMGHDFDTADRIRDQLRQLGVEVFDREKTWMASSDDYRRDDDGSATVDEMKVNTMLAARMQAKKSRDFCTADAIRDQLRQMGVEVFDKERTWKAGQLSGRGGDSHAGGCGGRVGNCAGAGPSVLATGTNDLDNHTGTRASHSTGLTSAGWGSREPSHQSCASCGGTGIPGCPHQTSCDEVRRCVMAGTAGICYVCGGDGHEMTRCPLASPRS